ncbi:MAG: N-acetylmuramic acid 6-phosphate etherase, partial [Rhodobacteraceae bacterium]|nr:N-acetylmuramic acid 6-phosphate etherase [Paracoccaceae bacterium]
MHSLQATEHTICALDVLPETEIARHLAEAQSLALHALTPVLDKLTQGGDLMARALQNGGNLVYAAAGSSGLMAASDALELPGTFGISSDRIHVLMAGGQPTSSRMPGGTEDDTLAALEAAQVIQRNDCVIVVSASGSTPYALVIAEQALAKGAQVICLANAANAPLFQYATLSIRLETPAEPLAGSTRLGAGTAQKVAMNCMSTLMAVKLGHVHDGMMVNLRVDNTKLQKRAVDMVANIANVTTLVARSHLEITGYEVKPAVLLALGAASHKQAT